MKNFIGIRHADASPKVTVDQARVLSQKGIAQCASLKIPAPFGNAYVSPATRTLQTLSQVTKNSDKAFGPSKRAFIIIEQLFGWAYLDEMDELYAEYGDNAKPYLTDKRAKRILALCQEAADIMRADESETVLLVAHAVITNLVAYYIFEFDAILDIELETATGIYVTAKGSITKFN